MMRIVKYMFVAFLFLFMFNLNIYAECSYRERKDLLNAAKNFDIVVEPKTVVVETTGPTSFSEEPITITYEQYSFDFIVSNLSNDIYIRYYNDFNDEENYVSSSDLKEGIYRFNVSNASTLMTYYFEIRSENNNCAGQVFYTKKIVKPIYNSYSEYSICQEEKLKNKEYCKKFVTKDLKLSESDFLQMANSVISEQNQDDLNEGFNLLNFLKTYWYYFVGVIILGALILIYLFIKKKREKLV